MSEFQTTNDGGNPYTPPTAPIIDRHRTTDVHPAPRLMRLAAFLINVVGTIITVAPFYAVYEYLDFQYVPDGVIRPTNSGWILLPFTP